MKKLVFALAMIVCLSSVATAQVQVKPYFRSDGTYVQPHERTRPNNTLEDNYSTKGNVNPHTGRPGTVDPVPHQVYPITPSAPRPLFEEVPRPGYNRYNNIPNGG